MPDRPKLLFVKSRTASFIELDQQLLSERYAVAELYQPGRFANPVRVIRAVLSADVVVGWWASWHTFIPFTLASLIRKPSLLIVGGFDTAAEPEFGYGYQLGGVRKHLARWIMRRARTLMTNSESSRREVERNCGIASDRVELVYHGIPDGAGDRERVKRRLALTVGILDTTNLTRKGLKPFVQAAAQLPDVDFVLAGRPSADAERELTAIAGANVTIAGWVSDDALERLFNEAAVYVQASRHEGFGVSLAEAMLHECIPVATTAGALPEVVGDTGIILTDAEPETVAAGIETALARSQKPGAGAAARDRVLTRFSVQQRREGLYRLVDALLG
jgi:glycosyltransferase involved in cell wall biosynthesis